ncbi:hypothetical protein MUK42_03679 [Musa troglodytarum]|uniref:Uncharacterized protein n=1 Tax=Musa troglodytarum TaxID=320322 RepID=A0A9E7G6M9_9LILI|nr:hypothetical protein MUK42_03679 [Musa troglodytarum]
MVFYPLSLQSPFQITLCRLECAQAMVFDPLSLQYLRFRSLSVVLNALPPSCTSSRVSFLLATMPTTRDWRCRSFDLVQGGILISRMNLVMKSVILLTHQSKFLLQPPRQTMGRCVWNKVD